jgi:Secretion system C-terminal sorting domain
VAQLGKQYGNDLQTINQTADELFEFFPTQNQWKTDSIKLTANFNVGDKLQVRFKNIEYWGNNIYLDNIQLYTKSYLNNITQKGYIIYPNPAVNVINIQHINIPTTLQYIQIINSIGKNIIQINYNGNAAKEIAINTSTLASGVYILQMMYSNKTITEKFVKMN